MKFLNVSLLSLIFLTQVQFCSTAAAARAVFGRVAPQWKNTAKMAAAYTMFLCGGVIAAKAGDKSTYDTLKGVAAKAQNKSSTFFASLDSLKPDFSRSSFDVEQDIREAYFEKRFGDLKRLYCEKALRQKLERFDRKKALSTEQQELERVYHEKVVPTDNTTCVYCSHYVALGNSSYEQTLNEVLLMKAIAEVTLTRAGFVRYSEQVDGTIAYLSKRIAKEKQEQENRRKAAEAYKKTWSGWFWTKLGY